jgi:hypothetical protein
MEGPRRGLSDDARFELAMNAAGHARRNRPATLLIGAGAVLALSAVAAALGWSARLSARRAYVREQTERAQVDRLSAEWVRLDEATKQNAGAEATRPLTNLVSTVESCARNAGLKQIPQPPRTNNNPRGPGVVQIDYVYNDVRDASLPALLEWIRQSTVQVPGLEVTDLSLHPQATEWSVNVTFRRVEKAGS